MVFAELVADNRNSNVSGFSNDSWTDVYTCLFIFYLCWLLRVFFLKKAQHKKHYFCFKEGACVWKIFLKSPVEMAKKVAHIWTALYTIWFFLFIYFFVVLPMVIIRVRRASRVKEWPAESTVPGTGRKGKKNKIHKGARSAIRLASSSSSSA